LSVGIFAIVTFAFGLFAGISSLNRRFVAPSIFGLSLLIFSGILISIPIESLTSWQVGLPITILSTIGIIFIAISKSEFY